MALRILLLEDVPADAALVERHLSKSGLEFVSQQVDTRARFEEALRDFVPDIILSDHGLPGSTGPRRSSSSRNASPPFRSFWLRARSTRKKRSSS